jgi:hypothetical protein
MADRILLSNDTHAGNGGIEYNDEVFFFSTVNESSIHGVGAITLQPIGIAKQNGRVVDFYIGVISPAVSASGFVSADISATVNINSATCLSTTPNIVGPILSTAIARKSTNAGGGVSAVVNKASANFSTGDQISINWNASSTGSAAAGVTGKGFYAAVRVRYAAV